jgi:hypothetical protein
MSAEYTLMQRQQAVRTAAASAAYAGAYTALQNACSECEGLRAAPAAVRLDARQRLEQSRQALAMALAGIVQAAWADGILSQAPDLGSAVRAVMSGLNTPAVA